MKTSTQYNAGRCRPRQRSKRYLKILILIHSYIYGFLEKKNFYVFRYWIKCALVDLDAVAKITFRDDDYN